MPRNPLKKALAKRVALRVVRLKKHRPTEFAIHFSEGQLRLPGNEDTTLCGNPGLYSLRFYERKSHSLFGRSVTPNLAKLGHAIMQPLAEDGQREVGPVLRQVRSVEEGDISEAIGGWISGWLGTKPAHFAPDIVEVELTSSDSWSLPSWLQRTADGSINAWAIHVHGRGATQAETARNFAHLQRLGFNNLSISYRNDGTASQYGRVQRGSLGLGTSEWIDLEAAVAFAKSQGASCIIVFAWSYGAAISTQFAARSNLSADVSGYIFDSPVISWRATLEYQVKLEGAPLEWLHLAERFLGNEREARSIGLDAAIHFENFEPTAIASKLSASVLLLHSVDDGYIPIEPCRELADLLPDSATLVGFQGARHCKLFNFDQPKYEQAIEEFVGALTIDPT